MIIDQLFPSNHTIPERLLWSVYIVDTSETTFEHEQDVPNYLQQMIPIFALCTIIEYVISYIKGEETTPIRGGISSIYHGLLMELSKLFSKGCEFYFYYWLYQYRLVNLEWSSYWTWWIAAMGVDFCYYWAHRWSHEISFLWSFGHHVHHSSEDFNLTVAFRQPALQKLVTSVFYYPLALAGIPLPALLVHMQFSLIYQFWIHTSVVPNLGPLEWIFNTPSHHRVHHGMNSWCLDKNHGSLLIIWDRLFGTFEAERKDEKIIYGLISQPQSFETLYLQSFYLEGLIQKAKSMGSWLDSIKAFLYGPAWNPGLSRLGEKPDVNTKTEERKKFCPNLSIYMNIYIFLHFIISFLVFESFVVNFKIYSWPITLMYTGFILLSFRNVGLLSNGDQDVFKLELLRCIFGSLFISRYIPNIGNNFINVVISACMSVSSLFTTYHQVMYNKQKIASYL